MLSEYITSLAEVSFHIEAYMYAQFRYSGKNPMRFSVFWRISVRFSDPRYAPLTERLIVIGKETVDDGKGSVSKVELLRVYGL